MGTSGSGAARGSAYVVLLLATFVGNLAGAMISAPINEVAADLDARPSAVVLVLSVFMIAMMLGSPAAGWITARIGPRRALAGSMAIMALAQVAAAGSTSLLFLVAMRAVQGAACAVLPPAVQQTLVRQWPDRAARSMAAWASAAAVGQAAGLPLGGFVADAVGWRGVFVVQAVLSSLVVAAIVVWAPRNVRGEGSTASTGLLVSVVGIGLPVVGVTWAAQRGPGWGWVPLVVIGAVVAVGGRVRLCAPAAGPDRAFRAGTATAAASMFAIGTVLAGVALRLGQELGRSPSEIGVVAVCFSVAMSVGAPLSARAAARHGPLRVLALALGVAALALTMLALLGLAGTGPGVLAGTVVLLVVTGCAVGALQANAAHQVMGSRAASDGSAQGLHNMCRFAGIACGYAWVAFAHPVGQSALTFGGAAVVAAGTLLLVGPPGRRAGWSHEPDPHARRAQHARADARR